MKRHLVLLFSVLIMLFSSDTAFSQIDYCYDWEADVFGYSDLVYNDQALLVSGAAGTEIIVYDRTPPYCDHDFTAWVYSELANSSSVLSYGRLESNGWEIDGEHRVFNAQYRTYCVTSAHGLVDYWSYDDGEIFQSFTDEYTALYTQNCYTFTPPSTPTPTPIPTPTPCPPGIDECPDLQATISPIVVVEKYRTADITVSVSNAGSLATTFSLRTTAGTGTATFSLRTTSKSFTGNVNSQILKIKGVTESSQIDNIIIEAKYNNRVLASDNFTVAVITSLTFGRFDSTYLPLDNNPGTDGIYTPEEGQRVYPDKSDAADATANIADRSLVKVDATVTPAIPGLKIYFGLFDLDDPSATGPPIDTTNADGKDNNGEVDGSKSGNFITLTGSACDNRVAGTAPNYVSTTECPVEFGGISTAYFRTTMQPGDNFAIAASLDSAYRNGIAVDATDGSRLINSANQTIPISGQANPDNVAGIRTNMLTVWRKLHIEIDSMGAATGNNVQGTFTQKQKISIGTVTLPVTVASPLEPNRFENGKIVFNGTSFPVVAVTSTQNANTVDTVTIQSNSLTNVTSTTPFTLYDDDDMDDDDSGNLNGDEGDDVREPNIDLLRPTDTACQVGTDGKIANQCNSLLPALITPAYDLSGSGENIPFSTNATRADIINIYNAHFNQKATESRVDFWTVYFIGAYQEAEDWDSDPAYNAGTRRGNSFVFGEVDDLNGIGVTMFSELNRITEQEVLNVYNSVNNPTVARWKYRPVGEKYTLAHELGHLFFGEHGDTGLMEGSTTRIRGSFSDTTINSMRGGLRADGRRITHP